MIDSYGFIHEKIDIKVLILFIMRRMPDPINIDILIELTMCDDGIGYFDVTDCISKLEETKHLKLDDGNCSLTAKGVRNGEILEKNLPYSVRTKAEEAVTLARTIEGRNSMIKTSYNGDDSSGYKVSLSLSDGVGDIISMELFAANERQANALEKGFRKNAEKLYHLIIEMIMDNPG